MKVKTSTLNDEALDWAVAKGEDFTEGAAIIRLWNSRVTKIIPGDYETSEVYSSYNPSTNFALGGPILSRERIDRVFNHKSGLWLAFTSRGTTHTHQDKSELVAGLRCVVASKLGDEVEIPEELL
jgi:hypothetical protein